ncbi:hypothetical protein NC651_028031 [Populus alba x Populus x berolinensis]|nr:hypothetical protein NC651_028031 [Populus alba x Populus x berolinensis]
MEKALELEPQVQIFERDNIKENPQCLWPINLFASIQSTSSGAQQGAEAVFCSFIEQLTYSTAKFPMAHSSSSSLYPYYQSSPLIFSTKTTLRHSLPFFSIRSNGSLGGRLFSSTVSHMSGVKAIASTLNVGIPEK